MKTRSKLGLFGLMLALLVPASRALAQPIVSLTFDDGLLSDVTAQALLDSHGMKGTFYIISGLAGTDPTYYLDWPPIHAIQADGHEIGGHTITHPDLTTLTTAEQMHEVCDGRAQLIAQGFSPYSFAYPYGNSTATTQAIVKSCYNNGRGAWCNFPNYSTPNDQMQGTCVESIPPGAAGTANKLPVDDNVDWIQTEEAVSSATTLGDLQTYVTNGEAAGTGWVILQFHFICADTDPTCGNGGGAAEQYGIAVSTFTAFLDWLQTQPVTVEPLGQVMGVFPPSATPIPAILSVVPSTVTVGGSSVTLTVNGVNFVSGSVVDWNASATTTTFVSSTTLSAMIPASDLTSVKITTLTVTNPGGIVSPGTLLTLVNPVPVLTTLSSTFTVVGSTGITLAATGSGFVTNSVIRWNGTSLTTTYVSSSTLSAVVPSTDLSTVKVDSVTVFNTTPSGGTSNTQLFTVGNPVPILTTLSSTFTVVGSSTLALTLTGSNFVSTSTVLWNGSAVSTTTFVNSTTLRANIPTSALATVGIDSVTVFNAAPGGGTSSPQAFMVGNPVPTVSSLSTIFVIAGGGALPLTVTGTKFVNGGVIQWNGSPLATTYVSSTSLTTTIPASDVAASTVALVTVTNPAPGGGTSSGLTFNVGYQVPVIVSLSTSTQIVNSPAFVLTVNGTSFFNGVSVVQWNGSSRITTFVNNTTLTAQILASDLASVGPSSVTVFTSGLGGGKSNTQIFTVVNPTPVLSTISSTFTIVGSSAFVLTVNGFNYVPNSIVQWNGSARATSYISPTQLAAQILASDLTSVGPNTVTVFTPTPGGGTSLGQTLTVGNPVPAISTLKLSSIPGSSSLALTVTGSNFVANSVVQWSGSPLETTYVNSTNLSTVIPATDLASAGTAIVTVFNPAPGGGISNGETLASGGIASISNPTLGSVTPTASIAGAPPFTMTVTGTNFANNVVVEWNNVPQITTLVSATELTAAIPASLVSEAGTAAITVVNLNTGSQSASQTFTIGSSSQGRVHPNPWRVNLHAAYGITFDEFPADTTIKIFTSSAHWVKTLSAPLGTATWDLTNDSGDKVASGYYIYLVTFPQGKTRGILAIIR